LLPSPVHSLFGWLVADDWCWFVLREEYYWLVAGGWFVLREKYCWLVADKPSEQAVSLHVTVPRRSNVLSHAKHECMTTTAEETEMPAHLSAEIMREMDSNL
jgi:hypothetical protein